MDFMWTNNMMLFSFGFNIKQNIKWMVNDIYRTLFKCFLIQPLNSKSLIIHINKYGIKRIIFREKVHFLYNL